MKILVTNDDGLFAEGIELLTKKLIPYASEILVVAPNTEMSATSHKLTLRTPLKVKKERSIVENVLCYSVEGTPADCVKVAINGLDFMPDIIFSGINNGYNIGNDIIYSGTVAAVSEGAFYNIKGVAVSCEYGCFDGVKYLDNVLNYLFNSDIYINAKIININIPKEPLGIKITRQGAFPFETRYELEEDGLYHIKTKSIGFLVENNIHSDVYAIKNNYVSISPLTVDRTDILLFEKLKK